MRVAREKQATRAAGMSASGGFRPDLHLSSTSSRPIPLQIPPRSTRKTTLRPSWLLLGLLASLSSTFGGLHVGLPGPAQIGQIHGKKKETNLLTGEGKITAESAQPTERQ